jgi:outer membrane protein assembly factor BamB
MNNPLYLAARSEIVCVDPDDGHTVWTTRLKSRFMADEFTSIIADGDRVYAVSGGYAYCLRASDGSEIWRREFKNFGSSAVYLFREGVPNEVARMINKRKDDTNTG